MTEPRIDPPVLRFVRAALGAGAESEGPPDAELLTRFVERQEHGAFELLVWRHAGMVLRVCRSVLGDHHASEDVAQAVFMALARGAGSIKKKESVAGWLHSVSWHLAKKAARRARKATLPLDNIPEVEGVESGSCQRAIEVERKLLIHQEVERLPDIYRLPVLLCYFEGLTYAQAAKRLNWPLGAIGVRIMRACEILNKRLSRRGVTLTASGVAGLIAEIPTQASAESFVTETVRAAVLFAARQSIIPGISKSTMELAEEAGRRTIGAKLLIASTLLICGLTLGGSVFLGRDGGESSPPIASDVDPLNMNEKDGLTLSPQSISPVPVNNPIPIKEEPRKEIKENVIEAFEKRGAVYGGFLPNPLSTVQSLAFVPGKAAAAKGIPGFSFNPNAYQEHVQSKGGDVFKSRPIAWDDDNDPLPDVDANFGLHLTERYSWKKKCLEKIAKLGKIQVLIIEGPGMSNHCELSQIRALKNVQSLHLVDCIMSGSEFKEWSDWKNLSDLHLTKCRVRQADFEALTGLKNLKVLELNNSRLTDSGLKQIGSMTNLAELKIDEELISDRGLRELAPATNLKVLELKNTEVTADGIKNLPIAANLEKFSCEIDLSVIVSSGKYGNLKELWLYGFGVGDGAKLNQLKKLRTIHLLQQVNVNATDLEQLRSHPSLKKIDCRCVDTELTPDTMINAIKKACPNCEIIR